MGHKCDIFITLPPYTSYMNMTVKYSSEHYYLTYAED